MARMAVINRENKRRKLVEKFSKQRAHLFEIMNNLSLTDEERMSARAAMQSLPRDSSPTRLRNRCELTGRSRGVFRKFGLCRNKLREVAFRGEVPGMTKASW